MPTTTANLGLPKPEGTDPFAARAAIGALADAIDAVARPLFDAVDTSQTYGGSNGTYGDLATVGPSITIPVDGVWLVTFGAGMVVEFGNAYMSLAVGGDSPTNDLSITVVAGSGEVTGASCCRALEVEVEQGDVIQAKYSRNTSSAAPSFFARWMKAELLTRS